MVWLPTGIQRKTVSTEIVAFSRTIDHTVFTIVRDLNNLDRMSLLKNVCGKVSKVHRDLEHMLSNSATTT